MRRLLVSLACVLLGSVVVLASDDGRDTLIAQHDITVTIPRQIVRPEFVYMFTDTTLGIGDTIKVRVQLNGTTIDTWKYRVRRAPDAGMVVRFRVNAIVIDQVK